MLRIECCWHITVSRTRVHIFRAESFYVLNTVYWIIFQSKQCSSNAKYLLFLLLLFSIVAGVHRFKCCLVFPTLTRYFQWQSSIFFPLVESSLKKFKNSFFTTKLLLRNRTKIHNWTLFCLRYHSFHIELYRYICMSLIQKQCFFVFGISSNRRVTVFRDRYVVDHFPKFCIIRMFGKDICSRFMKRHLIHLRLQQLAYVPWFGHHCSVDCPGSW